MDLATTFAGAQALMAIADIAAKAFGSRMESAEAQRLAVRIWGATLFEMKANCNRARHLVQQWEDRSQGMRRLMSFTVSDALLPELCRRLPHPITLHEMNRVDSSLRVCDFFHRQAMATDETDDLQPGMRAWPHYSRALGFAKDLAERGDLGRFNMLISTAYSFGAEAFGDEWFATSSSTIPDRIDLEARVPGDDV